MALLLRPISSFPPKISSKSPQRFPTTMNNYSSSTSRSGSAVYFDARKGARKLPVLLFDVMDTIVRVPFYEDIPAFFGYELIEDKLKLSAYLSWTLCSCIAVDRMKNVEAVGDAGMVGIHFKNAELLRQDLSFLGLDFLFNEMEKK